MEDRWWWWWVGWWRGARPSIGQVGPPPKPASQSASSRPSPKTNMREIVHLQVPTTQSFTVHFILFGGSRFPQDLKKQQLVPHSYEPQAGQCGNQIGAKFWEIISDEHGMSVDHSNIEINIKGTLTIYFTLSNHFF